MDRLVALAVSRRYLMVGMFVAVFVGGLIAFKQLNIEAYPDPTPPMVDIVTQSPGLSSEEIERYITIPIETQVAGIKNLRTIRTISLYGLSDVKLQFSFDYTYDEALQQVLNRLSQLPQLPNNVQPQISPTSPIGEIYRYRVKGANYDARDLRTIQDWTISPDLPQGGAGLWRLDVKAAGSGVTGDLLAHCIDTAMWLNGGIKDVSAMTETFIKERKHTLTGKVEKVGIDDACAFMCRFANGSLGLFESTRYARGHKALYTFEINGENASIKWDLHDLHRLLGFAGFEVEASFTADEIGRAHV